MRQLAENIWVLPYQARSMGLIFNAHMTIVLKPDGCLWLHSPAQLTGKLKSTIDSLGAVTDVICPNLFHHLNVRDYVSAYPDATIYAPDGLVNKRSDLEFAEELTNTLLSAFAGDFKQLPIEGMPGLREYVWLHIPSKTLILTDLLFWYCRSGSWLRDLLSSMLGILEKPVVSKAMRLMIKDKKALAKSVETIQKWDFERIILAHEQIVEAGAKKSFIDAFSFLNSAN